MTPEGPLGLPRLTGIGPLASNGDDIVILDSHFDLSQGRDIIYHIAEKEDMSEILDEGLIGEKPSFEERGQEKGFGELMEPEDTFEPSIQAQKRLNEALSEAKNVADSAVPRMEASELPDREDSVFFFPTRRQAAERAGGLDDPIMISVEFDKIPCSSNFFKKTECVVARLDVADDLFKLFFEEAKGERSVDREMEEELAMEYWETARLYHGGRVRNDREIYCNCDIPLSAFIEIAEVSRMDVEDIEKIFEQRIVR